MINALGAALALWIWYKGIAPGHDFSLGACFLGNLLIALNDLREDVLSSHIDKVHKDMDRVTGTFHKMSDALKEHECPGDGSTDQTCYSRIMTGEGRCTATEALERNE